jgi:hypothetical protein
MRSMLSVLAVVFALGGALAARAAEDSPMPQPVVLDGITYLAGGVGKEEADYMNARMRRYDLALYFVEQKTGKFLADVDLLIADRKGNVVFSKLIEAPIFLAKLRPGRYKIVAIESGREQQRFTRISGKAVVRLVFHWTALPDS